MYKGKKIAALIPAGGSGRRFGGSLPKQFSELEPGAGSILENTLIRLLESGFLDELVLVSAEEFILKTEQILSLAKERAGAPGDIPSAVFAGGRERQDSVALGLQAMLSNRELGDFDLLIIHDAVRPYVDRELVERCLEAALINGAAIAAVPVKDTIRQNSITLNRDGLYRVQTPQIFRKDLIIEAYNKAYSDGFYGTDDASLVERLGKPVAIAEGSYANIKITTPEDVRMPQAPKAVLRVGNGFDAHRLVPGRRLVLCGVELPCDKGLDGHSDADVAAHALMDALLGAAALGDIGKHFPDSDPAYEGADSMELLSRTVELIAEKGFTVNNVDLTIICERPKLAPYIEEMRARLSERLLVAIDAVSLKATTTEGLGFAGREEGIAALAIAGILPFDGVRKNNGN